MLHRHFVGHMFESPIANLGGDFFELNLQWHIKEAYCTIDWDLYGGSWAWRTHIYRHSCMLTHTHTHTHSCSHNESMFYVPMYVYVFEYFVCVLYMCMCACSADVLFACQWGQVVFMLTVIHIHLHRFSDNYPFGRILLGVIAKPWWLVSQYFLVLF